MKTIKRMSWALLIVFVSWQFGYGMTKTNSLIILDYRSGIDNTESAIALVSKHCGEIYHVFRGKVLIGYIPEDKVNLLVGKSGILNVFQNTTLPNKDDALVNSAIKAFNSLLQPEELIQMGIREKPLDKWKNDVRITYPTKSSGTGLSDRFTSEYMIGRVAVGIVIVEGNGDPQYDWTQYELDQVTSQIVYGLDLLANRASESNSNVCWFYEFHYSVPVPEEPIEGPSGIDASDEDYVISWIGYAMQALGYNPGIRIWLDVDYWVFTDGVGAIYDYVHDIRRANGTDWAFAMFVANGDTFRDGWSAWAMYWNDRHLLGQPIGRDHGGPYFVMTRDNDLLGIDGMWYVVAHETFHMFRAADEYHRESGRCRDSGSCDDKHGYLQIENRNCIHCDGSIPCIMRNRLYTVACTYTRYQAGLRDSDGDGPADPFDPNSHRFCWIGPPQVGGPVQAGDIIKTFTLEGEFVKSIAITPDNSLCSSGDSCMIMWDGTNAWGATCAPGIYLVRLNNGSAESILLLGVDPNEHTPVFHNFQFENGILYWRLSDTWAYVRLKIYDSSDQLVLYPIKDKAYHGNTDNETELSGLTEGTTYFAQFFGWGPSGHTSEITEYFFVYHCDLAAPTISSVEAIDTCLHLEWDDNNNCELGYVIQRKDDTNTLWVIIDTTSSDTESYTDYDVTGSETYYYRIKAYNDFSSSDYGNTVSKKARPFPPLNVFTENFYCNRRYRPIGKLSTSTNEFKNFKFVDKDCEPPYPDSILSDASAIYADYPIRQKPGTFAGMEVWSKRCSWYNHNVISHESTFDDLDRRMLVQTPPDTVYCSDWTYFFKVRTIDIYGDSSMCWPPGELDEIPTWVWPYACCVGPCRIHIGGYPHAIKLETPRRFSLEQNHPNPFNPETQIRYALPHDSKVKLFIYNVLGQKVRTLIDEHQTAGRRAIIWDGRDDSGDEVASGIYFYRLRADDYDEIRKMVVLK